MKTFVLALVACSNATKIKDSYDDYDDPYFYDDLGLFSEYADDDYLDRFY